MPELNRTIVYGTGGEAAIKNYLATSNSENIQFLTINDTTFVNSRDATNAATLVGKSGTTPDNPDTHFAFVEITRTENGRQYGMNFIIIIQKLHLLELQKYKYYLIHLMKVVVLDNVEVLVYRHLHVQLLVVILVQIHFSYRCE